MHKLVPGHFITLPAGVSDQSPNSPGTYNYWILCHH